MSINKTIHIGFVGKNPEIRKTKDGKEIANFSLATTESWKDRTGERMTKTQWHNVVVFNQAIVSLVKKYVHKGSKLYVEGQLETRKWTDKNGIEKYSTEIIVKNFDGKIVLLDKKNDSIDGNSTLKEEYLEQDEIPEDFIDDEIPF